MSGVVWGERVVVLVGLGVGWGCDRVLDKGVCCVLGCEVLFSFLVGFEVDRFCVCALVSGLCLFVL